MIDSTLFAIRAKMLFDEDKVEYVLDWIQGFGWFLNRLVL
jgi:hypothetical protein